MTLKSPLGYSDLPSVLKWGSNRSSMVRAPSLGLQEEAVPLRGESGLQPRSFLGQGPCWAEQLVNRTHSPFFCRLWLTLYRQAPRILSRCLLPATALVSVPRQGRLSPALAPRQ